MRNRLLAEALTRGIAAEYTGAVESIIPERLLDAGAFLDKLTGFWRYEFGKPYCIAEQLVWGTHMWVPIESLFNAIFCTYRLLVGTKRAAYLERLANPDFHQDTLAEMIPAHRVDPTTRLEFEVAGLGFGNRNVDWVIRPNGGRIVCLDVKRRKVDFINQIQTMGADSVATEPDHDPALLFRSVETKFVAADADFQLQGVWVFTDIKQDADRLPLAFAALDPAKVHFAVLGDWKPDIHVLVRREIDRQFLLGLFRSEPSTRFTYNRI